MRKQARKLSNSRRLHMLLGISLLLHGLLLGQWSSKSTKLEFAYQPQNLSLNLQPIELVGHQPSTQNQATTESNIKPVRQRQAAGNKLALKKSVTAAENSSHETTRNNQVSRVLPLDDQATLTNPAMNRARILQQIRRDLAQHFYYPPLARRKGVQGTVLLGFGISGQGAIHNIHVVKSSGYAILDLAAQDAMQRLENLSWYLTVMHGRDMDLELPIIFRLTEG